MRLAHIATPDHRVRIGSVLTTRDGEAVILQEAQPPRHAGHAGKVYVSSAEDPDGHVYALNPADIGLTWVEEEKA